MIYVYYSLSQKYFFDIKIKQISKDFLKEINDSNFFCLDAEKCDGRDIVNLCSDSFLFGNENKRVIVVKNAFFFSGNKNTEKFLFLLNFLKKEINKNVILFFFVYEDNIDTKNIFYKECKKNNSSFESLFLLKEYEWKNKIVIPLIKQKKINICDENVVKIISNRTKKNFASLVNEINKLKLYNDNISLELADKIISTSDEDNFFSFFNAFINEEKIKSIKILANILENKKISPNTLLSMMISNFRFLYMCNFLFNKNNNYVDIAKKLKTNEIRIKLLLKNGKNIKNKNIINILNDLYLIDRNTKNGKINCQLAIELFVIKWIIK